MSSSPSPSDRDAHVAASLCPECGAPGGRIHAFSCSRYPEVESAARDSREVESANDRYAIEHPHGDWHVAPPDRSAATPFPRGEEPGVPEDFDVGETLRAADEAASVAHDFIHGLNGVTREQASEAVWTIHNNLRPLFEEADLGY